MPLESCSELRVRERFYQCESRTGRLSSRSEFLSVRIADRTVSKYRQPSSQTDSRPPGRSERRIQGRVSGCPSRGPHQYAPGKRDDDSTCQASAEFAEMRGSWEDALLRTPYVQRTSRHAEWGDCAQTEHCRCCHRWLRARTSTTPLLDVGRPGRTSTSETQTRRCGRLGFGTTATYSGAVTHAHARAVQRCSRGISGNIRPSRTEQPDQLNCRTTRRMEHRHVIL